MSTTIMEEQLLAALSSDQQLVDAGCSAQSRTHGGVAVTHGGTEIGAWEWKSGRFVFTPAEADRAARCVETVAEAVRHTQHVIAGTGA